MSLDLHVPALGAARCSRIDRGVALRLGCAALVLLIGFLVLPASAADRASLRGDVTTNDEILTLGDLVAGAPAEIAETPVFRAPSLGEQGTIQTARILSAAQALGLDGVETFGRSQVTVTRAARRIGATEISEAIARVIGERYALDAATLALAFDGQPPALVVPTDVTDPVGVADLVYNPQSRRVSGAVYIGPSQAERRAQTVVSGTVTETVEIAILHRAIARGEAIRRQDVAIERRPRDTIPADARMENIELEGRVARRPLAAGAAVRQGDLVQPNLVSRGENVLIVFRSRGLTLTMRGTANEAGVMGDVINVTNPQSKRVLQATVSGPGQVEVHAPSLGPLASASRMTQ